MGCGVGQEASVFQEPGKSHRACIYPFDPVLAAYLRDPIFLLPSIEAGGRAAARLSVATPLAACQSVRNPRNCFLN